MLTHRIDMHFMKSHMILSIEWAFLQIVCTNQIIYVKIRSLNVQVCVSKIILNSSNSVLKFITVAVKVESIGAKVKRLKSRNSFYFLFFI